jgi:hypothetical protein
VKRNEWSELAAASLEQTSELPIVQDMADLLKQPVNQPSRVPADTLAVHLMGEKLPVLIRKGTTVLGRTSNSERGRGFDLSNYYARVLGVSREHAMITYTTDNGWMIEDLGSTNGTWVNITRLTPQQPHRLRSGDTVRLGQLTLFVYFQ